MRAFPDSRLKGEANLLIMPTRRRREHRVQPAQGRGGRRRDAGADPARRREARAHPHAVGDRAPDRQHDGADGRRRQRAAAGLADTQCRRSGFRTGGAAVLRHEADARPGTMMRDPPPVSSPALRARDTLRRVFGFAAFRGAQEDIVGHVCAGGDALVLMPTGGGKSLCYQIPALLREGTAVVVSPLIALMQDQVAALTQAGVRAACLNSSLAGAGARADRARVRGGGARSALRRAGAAAHAALPRAHRSRATSRCSRSTRRTAFRSGATISGPSTSACRCCTSAIPRCRASRSPPPPTRSRAPRSSSGWRSPTRACSSRASTGRTSATRSSTRTMRARSCSRFIRGEHPGEAGIVYCLSRRRVDETAAWLAGKGIAALPVSRRDGQRGPVRQPGALPARGRHRHRRDDRLRHGHRQAGRALRRASGPAEERRGLLPGDRPRGTRRPAGRCVDGLRPGRRRAAAAADRAVGGGRRVQARGERQARRAARSRGDRILPPRAAARLLRRGERAVRQLRQLPDAAADLGCDRRRPARALRDLPHRAALRRGARDRRPARQDRRARRCAGGTTACPSSASAPTSTTRPGAASSASSWRRDSCASTTRRSAR